MAFVRCCEKYLAVACGANVFLVQRKSQDDEGGSQSLLKEPVVLEATICEESNDNSQHQQLHDDSNDDEDEEEQLEQEAIQGSSQKKKNKKGATAGSATSSTTSNSGVQILAVDFSKSGQLLAVCNNRKQLIVWSHLNRQNSDGGGEWVREKHWNLKKQGSSLAFTIPEERSILVADRFGEVTEFDLLQKPSSNNHPPVGGNVLLGHVSFLFDMRFSYTGRFLMTADRDEKIRISNYPRCFDIQSFCLGHTEYVRALALCPGLAKDDLEDGILVSGGGDGCLKLWRCADGRELGSIDLSDRSDQSSASSSPSTILSCNKKRIRKICYVGLTTAEGSIRLAVVFEGMATIEFFDLTFNSAAGNYALSPPIAHRLSSCDSQSIIIVDISADIHDSTVYVLLQHQNTTNPSESPILVQIDAKPAIPAEVQELGREFKFLNDCEKLKHSLAEAKEQMPPMEKSVLYNNVDEYMERKKARTLLKQNRI